MASLRSELESSLSVLEGRIATLDYELIATKRSADRRAADARHAAHISLRRVAPSTLLPVDTTDHPLSLCVTEIEVATNRPGELQHLIDSCIAFARAVTTVFTATMRRVSGLSARVHWVAARTQLVADAYCTRIRPQWKTRIAALEQAYPGSARSLNRTLHDTMIADVHQQASLMAEHRRGQASLHLHLAERELKGAREVLLRAQRRTTS